MENLVTARGEYSDDKITGIPLLKQLCHFTIVRIENNKLIFWLIWERKRKRVRRIKKKIYEFYQNFTTVYQTALPTYMFGELTFIIWYSTRIHINIKNDTFI